MDAAEILELLDGIAAEHDQPFPVDGREARCPLDAYIPAVIGALRAVVVKCEAMRAESPDVGRWFADEFERVIGAELAKAEG